MMKILQQKYPTYSSQKGIWMSASVVAALVYLFLVVFQPFGTYNYIHASKYLLLVPYALITFFTFLIGDFVIVKHFIKWTWKNEISKILLLLFVCSLLSYWYNIYFINNADFNLWTLLYMVLFTYALGLPVCSIYLLGRYTFFKSTETKTEISIPAFETTENIFSIVPDAGEKISLLKSDFLFAQSEGNYSNIIFLKDKALQKLLLRISLKSLEKQIADNEIIRCHRSYILNIQNAVAKQGNAQGFKISLQHTHEKVPVSRKYIEKIGKIPI